VLNGRLYRAAFVPLAIALPIAAFSLGSRPAPLRSDLAPDAFDGGQAFADLQALAARFPHRRPGSAGDEALAAHVERALQGLGGTAGGGFTVHRRSFSAQTIDGRRSLTTVIAERPGATGAAPILVVAHRDAADAPATAELSGTAALLELARVFASRETQRAIVLASTSGGSGGDAGASEIASRAAGSFDAAIVLGDVAGAHERQPVVVPYSDGPASAPLQLARTAADALRHETGSEPATPSVFGQLAHLSFPVAAGEQGPLDAAGIPAILLQASGDRGPAPGDAVSRQRMEGFGRAALATVDALDAAPDLSASMQSGLLVQRKTFPEWALRILLVALVLPALIAAIDALARARRRGAPVARWIAWTLACAVPFLACALIMRVLGLMGVVPAPSAPVPAAGLGVDASAGGAIAAGALVLVLSWLLWPGLVRRAGLAVRPDPAATGPPVMIVLGAVVVAAVFANPFAALLALPALHVWLLLIAPELRPRRAGAVGLVALGLAPLALLVAFYAHELGLGPARVAWMGALMLAGGHVGLGAALLWSVALGCAAAMTRLVLTQAPPVRRPAAHELDEITIRGPLSYAGPGSLGGTESALRR
jgi:hypothetical protein